MLAYPPRSLPLFLVASFLLESTDTLAQEGFAPEEIREELMDESADEEGPPPDGWQVRTKLGASFSLNHNANVVGTVDGLTLQLGAVLDGEAVYREGPHRWVNSVSLQETQTRTPELERFIKSLDQLDVATTYYYRFRNPKWLGVFARATMNTQIFDGELVAAETVLEVRRIPNDVDIQPDSLTRQSDVYIPFSEVRDVVNLEPGTSLRLTRPFEPLNLRQSAGLFAEPYESTKLNVSTKLGIGAQEIIAHGTGDVLVTTIEDDGGRIAVVRELESIVLEVGAELELDLRGDLVEKLLSYYFTLNAFYPPFTTSEIERDFAASVNLRLKSGISIKLSEVVSIDYVLNVLRIPAVTEDFQVQNALLVSASFDLI